MVPKNLEDRNDVLYEKLVPGSGDATTLEGEMLRAINKIVYRYYNDGDYYHEGYGIETAAPAHAFLLNLDYSDGYDSKDDDLNDLQIALYRILDPDNRPYGKDYEDSLNDALIKILEYIESRKKYAPNTYDMLNADPLFEEEEPVYGCTDPAAENYDWEAEEDDGSCYYEEDDDEDEDDFAKGGYVNDQILSFSFNTNNISIDEIVEIVEKHTRNWRTSGGTMDDVSMHVTLRPSQVDDLESDLEGIDIFNLHKRESRYAKGGNVDYNEIKKEILEERGFTEEDFHKGTMSTKEAREIMKLANEKYSKLAKPSMKDLGRMKYNKGGKSKTYVDNSDYMEFISEVAYQITYSNFQGDPFVVNKGDGYTQFTDEAQDFYNEKYDLIETYLNRILNVYPKHNLMAKGGESQKNSTRYIIDNLHAFVNEHYDRWDDGETSHEEDLEFIQEIRELAGIKKIAKRGKSQENSTRYIIDNLHASVNEYYDRWDDGETSQKEDLEFIQEIRDLVK